MKNEITYTQQGDYLLPNLKLPQQPKVKIGIWGKRHERYIKQYHKIRYFNLLTSGTLVAYLADIDKEATEMYDKLVQQLAKKEGVTEAIYCPPKGYFVADENPEAFEAYDATFPKKEKLRLPGQLGYEG